MRIHPSDAGAELKYHLPSCLRDTDIPNRAPPKRWRNLENDLNLKNELETEFAQGDPI
jgi:hypothetical protein